MGRGWEIPFVFLCLCRKRSAGTTASPTSSPSFCERKCEKTMLVNNFVFLVSHPAEAYHLRLFPKKTLSFSVCVSPDELSGIDGDLCRPSCRHWGFIIFCKDSPCFCTPLIPQILLFFHVLSVLPLCNFQSVTPVKDLVVAWSSILSVCEKRTTKTPKKSSKEDYSPLWGLICGGNAQRKGLTMKTRENSAEWK